MMLISLKLCIIMHMYLTDIFSISVLQKIAVHCIRMASGKLGFLKCSDHAVMSNHEEHPMYVARSSKWGDQCGLSYSHTFHVQSSSIQTQYFTEAMVVGWHTGIQRIITGGSSKLGVMLTQPIETYIGRCVIEKSY